MAFLLPWRRHSGEGAALDPVLSIGRILLAQLCVGAAVAGVLWLWRDEAAALSWALGSLACVVPNAFFGMLMLVRRTDPRATLRAVAWGEAGKLALTVALFAAVFVYVQPLHPGLLFGGLIATQAVMWLALIWT